MTKTGSDRVSDNLKFLSDVGAQPWFFVPDTGTPGGSAVLVAPDGSRVDAVESQLAPGGTWGPRVGFLVPYVFEVAGEYRFEITQDDVVTVYEITVRPEEG
jgi:hypothetical protein